MKEKPLRYNREDIIRSFNWLGHKEYGFTELNAFHRNYKPGRENFEYNRRWTPMVGQPEV